MKIVKKNILKVTAASIIIMAGVFASQAVAEKGGDREQQKAARDEQKWKDEALKNLRDRDERQNRNLERERLNIRRNFEENKR